MAKIKTTKEIIINWVFLGGLRKEVESMRREVVGSPMDRWYCVAYNDAIDDVLNKFSSPARLETGMEGRAKGSKSVKSTSDGKPLALPYVSYELCTCYRCRKDREEEVKRKG